MQIAWVNADDQEHIVHIEGPEGVWDDYCQFIDFKDGCTLVLQRFLEGLNKLVYSGSDPCWGRCQDLPSKLPRGVLVWIFVYLFYTRDCPRLD